MEAVDILVIAVIGLILGGAAWFVRREKKQGVTCIGCPHSKTCASRNCGGCDGCGCQKS